LLGQDVALVRETNVAAVMLGFRKIKPIAIDAHEQGKILDPRFSGQICTFGRGDDGDAALVGPHCGEGSSFCHQG
jgi:hypothetical protein